MTLSYATKHVILKGKIGSQVNVKLDEQFRLLPIHRGCFCMIVTIIIIIIMIKFVETEGRHANAKAQEAFHHLASFPSSREEIS